MEKASIRRGLFHFIDLIRSYGIAKFVVDVAVPYGVVTEIGPVVAPRGTVALITKLLNTVNVAGVPLKVTEVAPEKYLPTSVTIVPTARC